MPSAFQWFGEKVKAQVAEFVDNRMDQAGNRIVARARELAPVRTGRLRASIGYTYRKADKTLIVHCDSPYGFFVEFGTRLMRARPFLRPALMQVGPTAFGPQGGVDLQFAEVNSSGGLPAQVENKSTVAHNQRLNRAVDRKHGARVVIRGQKLQHRHFYQPAHTTKFAGEGTRHHAANPGD